jgi:hypothetical protein
MIGLPAQSGCFLLYAAGTALCAQSAGAADWQFKPTAYVGSSYADNPRLLADGGDSSSGAIGELAVSLRRLTERSELSLIPRVRSARYSDDETLDSDDQYAIASYRWSGERSQWKSDLSLTRDTTLTSELESTGLVQSNRRHQATALTITPTVTLTERLSGGSQMYLMDSRYFDAVSTGLVDYRYMAMSLFSTLAMSDAGSSLTLTAQGGELFIPGSRGSETRDATLRLGWSFQPWSLWTATLSAGPSLVEADAGSDNGVLFDGELKRQGDLWSLTAGGGRSQSPTGRGVLTRRDEIKLNFTRQLTERLSANLGARWVRSEDLRPQQRAVTTFQVDYGRIDLGANWRMSRDWSLSLQLLGQTQNYELASDRAEGYRASLSIVWNGQPQSL